MQHQLILIISTINFIIVALIVWCIYTWEMMEGRNKVLLHKWYVCQYKINEQLFTKY